MRLFSLYKHNHEAANGLNRDSQLLCKYLVTLTSYLGAFDLSSKANGVDRKAAWIIKNGKLFN
jgi:hypothetical protein